MMRPRISRSISRAYKDPGRPQGMGEEPGIWESLFFSESGNRSKLLLCAGAEDPGGVRPGAGVGGDGLPSQGESGLWPSPTPRGRSRNLQNVGSWRGESERKEWRTHPWSAQRKKAEPGPSCRPQSRRDGAPRYSRSHQTELGGMRPRVQMCSHWVRSLGEVTGGAQPWGWVEEKV